MNKRLFIALPVPDDLTALFINFQETLNLKEQLREIKYRFVPPVNFHITVLFLGYIDENNIGKIQIVTESICQKVKPYFMSSPKIILAPPGGPVNMIWAGFNFSSDYHHLVKSFRDRFTEVIPDFHPGHASPHPHITLVRFKNQVDPDRIKLPLFVFLRNILFDRCLLMESCLSASGPEYNVISGYKFMGI